MEIGDREGLLGQERCYGGVDRWRLIEDLALINSTNGGGTILQGRDQRVYDQDAAGVSSLNAAVGFKMASMRGIFKKSTTDCQ
jgi:hypothetical protein